MTCKEERQIKETVQAADTIASDGALKRLSDLKFAIDKQLSDLATGLEEETKRYNQLKSAIEMKDREMKEIFEIDRDAHTLAALLESQKTKKLEFEGEKNVLQTRIDALERTVAIQEQQIQSLNQQLEKAYEKVQDIAVQAVSRTSSTYSGNPGKPVQVTESVG